MRKSLIAVIALIGSLGLTGCGAMAPGMSASQHQQGSAIAFEYLAPYQGTTLKAGDEVVIAARVAYDLPQSGGMLTFRWVDGNRRLLAVARHQVALKGRQGETFRTFTLKVPSGTSRITLVASAQGKTAVSHYSVVPASYVREEADSNYRSIR